MASTLLLLPLSSQRVLNFHFDAQPNCLDAGPAAENNNLHTYRPLFLLKVRASTLRLGIHSSPTSGLDRMIVFTYAYPIENELLDLVQAAIFMAPVGPRSPAETM